MCQYAETVSLTQLGRAVKTRRRRETKNFMNPPPMSPAPFSKNSGMAVASLVLGIVSIVLCLGPLTGIPAIICGHMALSRIRGSNGLLRGSGMATAGLAIGYCSFAMIIVVGMLSAIAIPNFIKARAQAQQNACIFQLKSIESAKEIWALENKKQPGAVPTDADLFGMDKQVSVKPVCPAGGTYSLNAVGQKATCSIPGHKLGNDVSFR